MVHKGLLKSRLRTSCRAKEQIIFERRKNGGGGGHFDSGLKSELSFKLLFGSHVVVKRVPVNKDSVGIPDCNLILSNMIESRGNTLSNTFLLNAY